MKKCNVKFKLFLAFLLAMLFFSLPQHAKKIKYGTAILYDGKAKKDVPTGEGTLTTTCSMFHDVLVGKFVGDGTVTEAQLKFPSGWKFQGTLSYEVEIDGSKVTYTLQDGDLYVISASVYRSNVADFTLKVTSDAPVILVRTPMGTSIDLKMYVYDTTVPGSLVESDFTSPLPISYFGDRNTATAKANCTILPTSKVNATSGRGTDPIRNLQEKDFLGITEPWTFLARPSELTMADGTKISREESNTERVNTVEYADGNILIWHYDAEKDQNGTVLGFAKKFSDGTSLGYVSEMPEGKGEAWGINYPDSTKAKGDIRFNGERLQITGTKTIKDYGVKDVVEIIMQENTFSNLGAKLFSGTLIMPDKTTVNYRRGHNEAEFTAREEARQKAVEGGETIALDKLDVTGEWCMKNIHQPYNAQSYYTLSIGEDNSAMLKLTTNYYATYATEYDSHPYYVRNVQTIEGNYTLSGGNIIFNWKSSSKADSGMDLMFECDNSFPKALRAKAAKMSSYFADMISQLDNVKVGNISDRYITLKDKYTFSRHGDEDAETQAARKQREAKNKLEIDPSGNISAFKHIYNDGVVTIEGGLMTIDYANGDKYVGTGHIGIINSQGKMTGNTYDDKFSAYSDFTKAVLSIENISDLEVYYEKGTFTKANGTTLTFDQGMTEKQQNQIDKNLGEAVKMINEMAAAELSMMKQKSIATKKKLLEEGFAPFYVNAMFDKFYIPQGTPKALIDRALQLGCHMTRHPVTMSDVHFDIRKSGETYAMVITNYNTGEETFEGFVKFHWSSHRAMYVGKEIR